MRPTLYEFAGVEKAFEPFALALNARCLADPELNHPFSHPWQHPERHEIGVQRDRDGCGADPVLEDRRAPLGYYQCSGQEHLEEAVLACAKTNLRADDRAAASANVRP